MWKHHLRATLRSLRRQRGFAGMNVAGLAVGVACCLTLLLFVRHELSHDAHHERAERIVRIHLDIHGQLLPITPSVVAPMLVREAPEVEAAARLFDSGAFQALVVRHGETAFEERRFFFADSTVFDVFTLPLTAGNPLAALARPNTVVLTSAAARRYFPAGDPLGEILLVNSTEYEVTGVLAEMPSASHLQFDFLASFSSLSWAQREMWSSANFLTYVLLRDAFSGPALTTTLDALLARARGAEEVGENYALTPIPLRNLYLDGEGRRPYVYMFSAIALLILLIACVNYMNLATARATRRAREVGVRKVSGAARAQLMRQFYGESALLAFTGVLLGALLAIAAGPLFELASGVRLSFSLLDPQVVGILLAMGLFITLLAGSYPALLLSSFDPAGVLRGSLTTGRGAAGFRRSLVTFQFAVTVFLLIGTAVIYHQLHFLQSRDLGFRGDQVLALPTNDRLTRDAVPVLKQRLQEMPGVLAAAAIDRLPGGQTGGYSLEAEGFQPPAGYDYYPLTGVPAEPGVAGALGLEMLAGRDLEAPEGFTPGPGEHQYLINEGVLRATGWTPEEAIGKRMSAGGDGWSGTVAGVFRDYHFLPLHQEIGPMAFFIQADQTNNLLVRVNPEDLPATLSGIEAAWQSLVPHRPFAYRFLDDAFAAHYERERRLGSLFALFALLAVFIACLGLLGLAAYAAERRTREIGIRKVLGAGVRSVVMMLSREFAILVAIGFLIAVPVAYGVTSRWLDGFAYRIDLSAWLFIGAGAATLLLALLVVASQALRAATVDPVHALKRA
jgi:putative ABC transport system permease protein